MSCNCVYLFLQIHDVAPQCSGPRRHGILITLWLVVWASHVVHVVLCIVNPSRRRRRCRWLNLCRVAVTLLLIICCSSHVMSVGSSSSLSSSSSSSLDNPTYLFCSVTGRVIVIPVHESRPPVFISLSVSVCVQSCCPSVLPSSSLARSNRMLQFPI